MKVKYLIQVILLGNDKTLFQDPKLLKKTAK